MYPMQNLKQKPKQQYFPWEQDTVRLYRGVMKHMLLTYAESIRTDTLRELEWLGVR